MVQSQPGWQRRGLQIAAVAAGYWLTAWLSMHLALVRGQVTPIWPPTGIAVFALLRWGRAVWPGVTLGALLANLPLGPTLPGVIAISVGNTAAPVASTWMLRHVGFRLEIDRFRDALALIALGALAAMLISATCGGVTLLLTHAIDADHFWSTWAVWWAGDAMGVMLVAPFLLSVRGYSDQQLRGVGGEVAFALSVIATAVISYLAFASQLQVAYVGVIPVMASAWLFRQRSAAHAMAASGAAIWTAVTNTGSFAGETLNEKILTLQLYNVTVALASFVFTAVVIDRQRREELARRYLAAELANETKTEFLNTAAHELRTPLSVVLGYASMLNDGSFGEPPQRWLAPLQALESKAGELNRIVDSLLAASRLEADPAGASRQRIDLRDSVAAAVARARPLAELDAATLSMAIPHSAAWVDINPEQIGRVIDNLINNALAYSPVPASVSVSLAQSDGCAVVEVRDNGVGIDPDQHEAIFERFLRLNNPSLSATRGSGLGLYISRHLAQAHGGDVSVKESVPGEGSTFSLRLPLHRH